MKEPVSTDLRVQRTREAIRTTFSKMLIEMDYLSITVKELTTRARINRKTFYLHYTSIDDLLEEMQTEIAEGFIERTKAFDNVREIDKMTREYFLYLAEQGPLGERIICNENFQYISSKITKKVMTHQLQRADKLKKFDTNMQNIISAYLTASANAIYRQWVQDGKKIPLEKVIALAIKLSTGFTELVNNKGNH